jgi:hypothetical protein
MLRHTVWEPFPAAQFAPAVEILPCAIITLYCEHDRTEKH